MHLTTAPAPVSWLQLAEQVVTRADVLAAVVAGDRTKQDLAARFGITLHPVLGFSLPLFTVLNSLVCQGLLNMRVVDRQWHYLPSRRGRALAAARH